MKRARNEEDDAPPTGSAQVLPVARLPDDFSGDPEDGATFLALAARENAKRPFVTRVEAPAPKSRVLETPSQPETLTERHPVLPRESWAVVFAAHFAAYRAHIASWRDDSAPSSDDFLPLSADAEGWRAYVDGQDEMDEEEAANARPVPREPLLGVLRRLDTHTSLAVLEHLTPESPLSLPAHRGRWLFALLATLPSHLDSESTSRLRSFAREIAGFIAERYTGARGKEELEGAPVQLGFYGDPAGSEDAVRWTLGARRKRVRDAAPRSEPAGRDRDVGGSAGDVDGDIARAWVAIHSVVAGWAQWDLVDEFERMMSRLPLP